MAKSAAFTNFNDLLSYVNNEIKSGLETEVADEIKKEISKKAKNNVIKDTLGREADGIDDIAKMKSNVNGTNKVLTLVVKDTAKPSPSVFGQPFSSAKDAAAGGTMFASWIENGEWVDLKALLKYRHEIGWNPGAGEKWGEYYNASYARIGDGLTKKEHGYKPRREPRPFISLVQSEINSNPQNIISLLEKRFK